MKKVKIRIAEYMKAKLIAKAKEIHDDGTIIEIVIWELQQPIPPSKHIYKYRLYLGLEKIMKVIIEIAKKGTAIQMARQQIAAAKIGNKIDFHLYFESARSLFTELTSTRLDLLYSLSNMSPCNVDMLAQTIAKNYSDVYNDVVQLEKLGLIERTDNEMIILPFDSIEILMYLTKAA